MNDCGTGAEKVWRFISTRFFDFAQNDKVFGLRPIFREYQQYLAKTNAYFFDKGI